MAAAVSREEALPPKQGSKVFSKLLSRESAVAAPSFRVYYGVASSGSVPFLWESQPGTPKNDAGSEAALPPLTPPPSYYAAKAAGGKAKAVVVARSKTKKRGFFGAILPRIILHRRARSSSSPSSSCSSSSSSAFSSSASSRSALSFRSARSPAACSSMGGRVYVFSDGEEEQLAQPACFSMRHDSFRGVAMALRSALASVSGHGATAATAPAAERA